MKEQLELILMRSLDISAVCILIEAAKWDQMLPVCGNCWEMPVQFYKYCQTKTSREYATNIICWNYCMVKLSTKLCIQVKGTKK